MAFRPARQGHFGQIGVCFSRELRDFSVTQQFLIWRKSGGHINPITLRSWCSRIGV